MINIKKELSIFFAIFIIASLVVHYSQWFSHPIEHLNQLFSHPMPYHPFLYVFLIYLLIGIFRGLIKLINKLFRKK